MPFPFALKTKLAFYTAFSKTQKTQGKIDHLGIIVELKSLPNGEYEIRPN